jgi:tripartite-type tricarboxylate transporter receptor subunit TctC
MKRRDFITLLGGAAAAWPFAACAQQWPMRAIKVVSPFPAGSASDSVSRVVLDQASRLLGQPVIIEARPGAGGIVGFAAVA